MTTCPARSRSRPAPPDATILIDNIVADSLVEGTETVTITLDTITASDPGITIGTASDTIDILDGDTATVSIAGTIDGNETGPVNGVFTVTPDDPAVSATVISYTVTGTATAGTDYTALSGSVTVPAGSTSATIFVTGIVPDSLVEGAETVVITLNSITMSSPGVTINSFNDIDSIDILDGDAATVSIVGTTDGNEAGPINGVFTVSQTTASVNDTVLTYTVAGSATSGVDYTALSGSVTITGGLTSASITVPVIAPDDLVEGTETVTITLTGITADPGVTIGTASDGIDILDGDSATVSISGTGNGDETGSADGEFTVEQTTVAINDTVLTYTVAGTATPGAGGDYTALTGTVTIPAGATEAFIDVTGVIDDSIVEGTETVEITLSSITAGDPGITINGASNNDSIDILDNDTATVSIANNGDAAETGTAPGQFLLSMTSASETATVVSYNVTGSATAGGTDYTTLPVNVTIPAGATTATLDVTGIIDDTIVEGAETVIVTLTGTDNGLIGIDPTPATVNILDNDSATVSIANSGDAAETGTAAGEFTLTMTTASESATVVSYNVTGSATAGGTDYTTLPINVTIPAGLTTATLDVTGIVDDAIVEGTETVVVTLTGTDDGLIGIDATPATVNIADNDTATVSIANNGNAAETGSAPGQFLLTMTTASETATVVSYNVTGSATAGGTDYTTLPINVTIPAGATTATLDVTGIIDDTIVEGTETVIVTLTGTDNPTLIGVDATPATVNILDSDTATVSIANTGNANETGSIAGEFTVSLTTTSETATVVSYTVTGTATGGGTDYTTLPINVTIPAGLTTATLDVAGIIDDSIVEDTETVIVTLTGTDNPTLIGVDPTPATVNILDNDTATVSIANNGDAAETGTAPGQFLLSMTTSSESATVVSYNVTGTATAGGTDYTTLPINVTIPAGSTSVTLDVTGIIDDAIVEDTETVIVTLTGTDNGLIGIDATPATVNIADNDTATVSIANNGDANETGSAPGQFLLSMTTSSESATVVSYNVTGTATAGGTDYTTLPVNVTIPAGATTATLDVSGIIDDSIVEGTETVIVTLTGTDNPT